MAAARKRSRYGHRDATMTLLAYRHGLRASEICDLQWHQVELTASRLHVLAAASAGRRASSERGGPIAPKSFHTLIVRLGERAGMAFPIHPYMLRHGCGYAFRLGWGTEISGTRALFGASAGSV